MPEENLEYYTRRVGEPLTAEEKAEIAALKGRPIVYDEDCPPMSKKKSTRRFVSSFASTTRAQSQRKRGWRRFLSVSTSATLYKFLEMI